MLTCFTYSFLDALSNCIFWIFLRNWSPNGPRNKYAFGVFGFQGSTQNAHKTQTWFFIDFGLICDQLWHPFWYLLQDFRCRCRHLFRWFAAGPTFKPRKLIRWLLKGCGGYAPRLQWLLASLLYRIFDFFRNLKQKHSIVKPILLTCCSVLKPFISRSWFHSFSCFFETALRDSF